MSRIARILILFAVFSLDVQVRAASHVIRATVKRTFSDGDFHIHMAGGSLLEKQDDETYQLIDGQFLVELPEGIRLKTPFATIQCLGPKCEGMFVRKTSEIEVRALRGGLVIRRLGEKKDYLLPPAMRMTVYPVAVDGKSAMEFPQSLPWDSTVKDWAKLYPGTPAEFKETLIQFREEWREAVDQASQLQLEYASREIASHEKAVADAEARREVQEKEDESLRRLFRQKNFIDP